MSAVAGIAGERIATDQSGARSEDLVPRLAAALDGVEAWVIARNYKGYDPGDGLTSWVRPLTLGLLFGERVHQQVVWRAPCGCRPLRCIRPLDSTTGRCFMAWGPLLRHAATGSAEELRHATACLDWLVANRSPDPTGYAWGNYRLGLDVQNLFDKGYDLPLGGMSLGDYKATGDLRPVPGRGRSFNIGLTAKF